MPEQQVSLPILGRAAEVRAESVDRAARRIDIVWTTGATVQRVRWEGWDDRVEYDEELEVSPGAVRIERLNAGGPFLNAHNAWRLESVIGSVVPGSVRLEGGRGYASIQLTAAEDAAGVVERILDGSVRFVSVGYRVYRYDITRKDGAREHWRAVDWEPLEISAVPIPADPGAVVRGDARAPEPLTPCVLFRQDTIAAPAAFSKGQTMPDTNMAAGAADEQSRGAPQALAPAPAPAQTPAAAAAPEAPDPEAIRAEERSRVAEIDRICARHSIPADVRASLITGGVTVAVARERVLDHLAAHDPAGRTVESIPAQARGTGALEVAYRDAVSSALLHRHDPGHHALVDGGRDFRGMTLLEMARHTLERMGVSTRGMSKMEVAGEVFARAASAYHTSSDFPMILANVANKTLRAAYDSTPRTFTAWARRSTITDFKPVQRTQLGGAPNLDIVPESGEFTYGTMGEGREVYALLTYGKIISVTRQALINDDLDAFTRIPAAFGASAADLESDIVYSILINNPVMGDTLALFHSTHGNLGTASVLDEANLTLAFEAFARQRGLEGRQISVLPSYIIVPPGQRAVEARKIMTATTPNVTSGVNPYAGRMSVVEEVRLLPASGAKPWYLAADPSRIDTVEYAYLEGQEGLFTETRMGFTVDGMEIKARADFAAKAIDWRGLYRNPGL